MLPPRHQQGPFSPNNRFIVVQQQRRHQYGRGENEKILYICEQSKLVILKFMC